MAAINAILLTAELLILAPPEHTANFAIALTDTELSAVWRKPVLPYLGKERKEGKEVIPRSDYSVLFCAHCYSDHWPAH